MLKQHLLTTLVIAVTLTIPIGGMYGATSTVVIDNLIVNLGDPSDISINSAISVLEDELIEYTTVDFRSNEYYKEISLHPIGNMIFVGHGSNEYGIKIKNDYLSWQKFGKIINNLHVIKEIHLLSCDSTIIREYVPNQDLGLTFSTNIDARVGALAISSIINTKSGLIERALKSIDKLFTLSAQIEIGKIIPLTLGLGDLNGEEQWLHTAYFMFLVFLTITEVYIPPATWNTFALALYVSAIGIAYQIHYYFLLEDYLEAAAHIWDFFMLMWNNDLDGYLWDHLSWYDYLTAIAIITAFIALGVVTGTISIHVSLLLLLTSWAFGVGWFAIDWNDCDDDYHDSNECIDLPPHKPNTPGGPSSVYEDTSYSYSFYTTDPDSSSITFEISWGDGSSSTVSATSGVTKYKLHTYYTPGSYTIKVRAKSSGSSWSLWSNGKTVTVMQWSSPPSPPVCKIPPCTI